MAETEISTWISGEQKHLTSITPVVIILTASGHLPQWPPVRRRDLRLAVMALRPLFSSTIFPWTQRMSLTAAVPFTCLESLYPERFYSQGFQSAGRKSRQHYECSLKSSGRQGPPKRV